MYFLIVTPFRPIKRITRLAITSVTDGNELALNFIPLFIEATECAHDLTFFPHISEDVSLNVLPYNG